MCEGSQHPPRPTAAALADTEALPAEDDSVLRVRAYPLGEGGCFFASLSAAERTAAAVNSELRAAEGDWLWHCDRIALQAERDGEVGGWTLRGCCSFGDSCEDEWVATGLLLRASASPAGRGLAFRITDGDGQFMLIEAAEVLPGWMEPEGMENRFWAVGGRLVALPPAPVHPGQCMALAFAGGTDDGAICGPLPLPAALRVLANCHPESFAVPEVQELVMRRVPACPGRAASEHAHWARCVVPTPVACALAQQPQLVAPAVLALCAPGATGLRHAKAMRALAPARCGLSEVSVRFSRTLYAMLRQHSFVPPGAHFPLPETPESAEHSAALLGGRLACGWEIAYQQALSQRDAAGDSAPPARPDPAAAVAPAQPAAAEAPAPQAAAEAAPRDSLRPRNAAVADADSSFESERDRTRKARAVKSAGRGEPISFAVFLARLKRIGYFGSELEGSRLWREKEQQARESFERSRDGQLPGAPPAPAAAAGQQRPHCAPCCPARCPADCAFFGAGGHPCNFADVHEAAVALWCSNRDVAVPPPGARFELRSDDSDAWMYVDQQDLDADLAARFSGAAQGAEQAGADEARRRRERAAYSDAQARLSRAVAAMQGMMLGQSGHQGIEPPSPPAERSPRGEQAEAAAEQQAPPGLDVLEAVRRRLLRIDTGAGDGSGSSDASSASGSEHLDDLDLWDEAGAKQGALSEMAEYMRVLQEELCEHEGMSRPEQGDACPREHLAANMLHSFEAQGGAPGPVGNILGLAGAPLPPPGAGRACPPQAAGAQQ
eukprot:TRINITY_DN5405_c0_g1_i1.p1 TRINITY_DN5405_c0_g1~~TRINITY_DN5405_c0_g1_i1.p1  ORF type:complete len:805 (+),score=170.40 TRINITY_DN5405_c0_g1_i1:81-2417(+)